MLKVTCNQDPCERLGHGNGWPVGPTGEWKWKRELSLGDDPISRALPFAGGTPGPSARMLFGRHAWFGVKAVGSCGPHVVWPPTWIPPASHLLACSKAACPEGASVLPAKGNALVVKDARRPTIFPPLRLSARTGQPLFHKRWTLSVLFVLWKAAAVGRLTNLICRTNIRTMACHLGGVGQARPR